MTATPYDVGIICEDLNWSLLGLKSYSLGFCLKKICEGFLFNVSEGLPLGTSVGKLLNSPVLSGREGLARGAYSSGAGTSGSPLWTLEGTKHRLLGIHVGFQVARCPDFPNLCPAPVLRQQLVRYVSRCPWTNSFSAEELSETLREHMKITVAEAKFGKPWKHANVSLKHRRRLSRTQQLWYAAHEDYLPEWDQEEDLGQEDWERYDEREQDQLDHDDWMDIVYGGA